MTRRLRYLLTPFIGVALVATVLAAPIQLAAADGKLNSFEKSANSKTSSRKNQKKARSHQNEDDDESFGEALVNGFFRAIFRSLFGGGSRHHHDGDVLRIRGGSHYHSDVLRVQPPPLTPCMNFDLTYHSVESDVEAIDILCEAGLPWVRLHMSHTRFHESSPHDHMAITRALIMLRLQLRAQAEFAPGFGALNISGNGSNTRFAITAPLLIRTESNWGLELRPVLAPNIFQLDAALSYRIEHVALKGGYRMLSSPDESLNGPYMGLSFQF
jgi:hypothetical protein